MDNRAIAVQKRICKEARKLMRAKNADYSTDLDPYANFRACESLLAIHPVKGVLMRMADKISRVNSFIDKGELQVKGEGVKDSLIDIINYAALAAGLLDLYQDEPEYRSVYREFKDSYSQLLAERFDKSMTNGKV